MPTKNCTLFSYLSSKVFRMRAKRQSRLRKLELDKAETQKDKQKTLQVTKKGNDAQP